MPTTDNNPWEANISNNAEIVNHDQPPKQIVKKKGY